MKAIVLGLGCAAALVVVGCGDEGDSETPAPSCACDGDQCQPGQCTLRVVVNDPCWGNAKVFLNDTSAEAEPAGIASADAPFESCEGFRAPVVDDEGNLTQEGDAFTFLIESEDGRSISPEVTQTCAGSQPVVFQLEGCQ